MGPGRRIYMALFAGAVIYSCFLCLFAVSKVHQFSILPALFRSFTLSIFQIRLGVIDVYRNKLTSF